MTYKILYIFYVDIIVVLCVAGTSKDVEDHSGETSKPKAHNNQDEKGEIIFVLYIANKLATYCDVYDIYQILIWTTSTMWRR